MLGGKEADAMKKSRPNTALAHELAALAFSPDAPLIDLLLEDGLVSPAEARREHSAPQLLALLRRIFGEAPDAPLRATDDARPHRELFAARISLRAPPQAA